MAIKELALSGFLILSSLGGSGCAELERQRNSMNQMGVELDSSSRPGNRYNSASFSVRYSSNPYWRIESSFPREFPRRDSSNWEWKRYEHEKRSYENRLRELRRHRETHSIDIHGNILLPYGQGRPSRIERPQRPSPQRNSSRSFGNHRR